MAKAYCYCTQESGFANSFVSGVGLEPTQPFGYIILSDARKPIPPSRHRPSTVLLEEGYALILSSIYAKVHRIGLVVKRKHGSLQNSYARVRFPPRPLAKQGTGASKLRCARRESNAGNMSRMRPASGPSTGAYQYEIGSAVLSAKRLVTVAVSRPGLISACESIRRFSAGSFPQGQVRNL